VNASRKHENESEALLDRIAAEMRDQVVPPIPKECLDFDATVNRDDETKLHRSRPWLLLAIAASIALIACTAFVLHRTGRTGRPRRALPEGPAQLASAPDDSQSDGIQSFELADAADLAAISSGIDEIQVEIKRLERQAELLDARRRANELLGVMASLDR
jgi:hypothetical protein